MASASVDDARVTTSSPSGSGWPSMSVRKRLCRRRWPSSSARYSTGRFFTAILPSANPPAAQASAMLATIQDLPALGGATSRPIPSGSTPSTVHSSGGNVCSSSQAAVTARSSNSAANSRAASSCSQASSVTRPAPSVRRSRGPAADCHLRGPT